MSQTPLTRLPPLVAAEHSWTSGADAGKAVPGARDNRAPRCRWGSGGLGHRKAEYRVYAPATMYTDKPRPAVHPPPHRQSPFADQPPSLRLGAAPLTPPPP